jgi:RNA polymerase sigma-70 factor, ECF subfamily
MEQMSPEAIRDITHGLAGTLDFEADFDALVECYRPRIFRFALASLRDRDAAETIAQDCFIRAYKAQHSFRNDCSVQTWLMQIAVNLVRDHLRSRRLQFWKRTQPIPELAINAAGCVSGERSPEMAIMLRQQLEAVWSAAERLPERQKTVFLLRFVEDMDILEIAAAAGMKEGTVKSHLFRALERVRERLGVRP